MGIAEIAFYLFSLSTLIGGFFTVVSRNPVHSVLWLILSFLSSAGLFVLLGAEFVAMLLIIVYVGAVAVLFLFVVMMLDINFAEMRAGFKNICLSALLLAVFWYLSWSPLCMAMPLQTLDYQSHQKLPTLPSLGQCSTQNTPSCSKLRD